MKKYLNLEKYLSFTLRRKNIFTFNNIYAEKIIPPPELLCVDHGEQLGPGNLPEALGVELVEDGAPLVLEQQLLGAEILLLGAAPTKVKHH